MTDIWVRLKNLKHSHGIEIQSRNSIIIPLMIEENVLLEQGLPQGFKGPIAISLMQQHKATHTTHKFLGHSLVSEKKTEVQIISLTRQERWPTILSSP